MIIAPAIKTKNGKIYISRNSHSEILMLYPNEFELAEQGFITSECKFVNRKEALKIAKKYNQINNKIVDNDELYSEDLFLAKELEKNRYVDKLK